MTSLPTSGWGPIDTVYTERLSEAPPDRRWLLAQTLATAHQRRALLGALPAEAGARIVDVGCGFGASSLELAARAPSVVTGVDRDREVLEVAAAAAADVGRRGPSPAPSTVTFLAGDAYHLPVADRSMDGVFSRFVFQHLSDPAAAATEVARVLRPGGWACVVDVDDGLSISEPPASPAYSRLAAALAAAQSGVGGDRRIGRRLAGLLDAAGLSPSAVLVLPQAAYHQPTPGGAERALLVERLRSARPGLIDGGHMTAEQFDSDLQELQAEDRGPTCEIEGHVAVMARRVDV